MHRCACGTGNAHGEPEGCRVEAGHAAAHRQRRGRGHLLGRALGAVRHWRPAPDPDVRAAGRAQGARCVACPGTCGTIKLAACWAAHAPPPLNSPTCTCTLCHMVMMWQRCDWIVVVVTGIAEVAPGLAYCLAKRLMAAYKHMWDRCRRRRWYAAAPRSPACSASSS